MPPTVSHVDTGAVQFATVRAQRIRPSQMRRAVWGLLQAGILANKCLSQKIGPVWVS